MKDKTRILMVEDESIVAMDIKDHLIKLGYDVTSIAKSGIDALLKAELEKPDLILMDIRLKGELTGIDVGKIIKQKLDIPIIYLTALNDEQTFQSAQAIHPSGFIVKPFVDEELQHTIEDAIQVKTNLG